MLCNMSIFRHQAPWIQTELHRLLWGNRHSKSDSDRLTVGVAKEEDVKASFVLLRQPIYNNIDRSDIHAGRTKAIGVIFSVNFTYIYVLYLKEDFSFPNRWSCGRKGEVLMAATNSATRLGNRVFQICPYANKKRFFVRHPTAKVL